MWRLMHVTVLQVAAANRRGHNVAIIHALTYPYTCMSFDTGRPHCLTGGSGAAAGGWSALASHLIMEKSI